MAYDRQDRDFRTRPYGRDRFQQFDQGRNDGRFAGSRDRYDRFDRDDDRDDRGWFDRAGDEVASWFGDEEAERRRRQDHMMDRNSRPDSIARDFGRDRSPSQPRRDDWSRNEGSYAATGPSRDIRDREDRGLVTSRRFQAQGDDRFGAFGSRDFDPHYNDWRQRQIDALDRDYDDYRRENQARFENDFGSWRERRLSKRSLLGSIREHMEVVGSDDGHVGTIDRVAGDRIILTKSDEDANGAHHSLSCSDIDTVTDDKVVLDCKADEAKSRWRDESRSRALFEREDQGEAGPRILDRSFEGTYR